MHAGRPLVPRHLQPGREVAVANGSRSCIWTAPGDGHRDIRGQTSQHPWGCRLARPAAQPSSFGPPRTGRGTGQLKAAGGCCGFRHTWHAARGAGAPPAVPGWRRRSRCGARGWWSRPGSPRWGDKTPCPRARCRPPSFPAAPAPPAKPQEPHSCSRSLVHKHLQRAAAGDAGATALQGLLMLHIAINRALSVACLEQPPVVHRPVVALRVLLLQGAETAAAFAHAAASTCASAAATSAAAAAATAAAAGPPVVVLVPPPLLCFPVSRLLRERVEACTARIPCEAPPPYHLGWWHHDSTVVAGEDAPTITCVIAAWSRPRPRQQELARVRALRASVLRAVGLLLRHAAERLPAGADILRSCSVHNPVGTILSRAIGICSDVKPSGGDLLAGAKARDSAVCRRLMMCGLA